VDSRGRERSATEVNGRPRRKGFAPKNEGGKESIRVQTKKISGKTEEKSEQGNPAGNALEVF